MTVTIHHGDSREVLAGIPSNSIDSCATDAPYALVSVLQRFGNSPRSEATENTATPYGRTGRGFMGQRWDNGETAHDPAFWAEVLRVLKPGAHLVAFSGTRTQHRQVCAIEDAGFEIRDTVLDIIASDTFAGQFLASLSDEQQRAFARVVEEAGVGGMIAWAFGSGFPKSHNQSGDWAGWGSALKPAFEPICIARKPMIGTISANLAAHGTGALNIDACRIGDGAGVVTFERHAGDRNRDQYRTGTVGGSSPSQQGRWPANVLLSVPEHEYQLRPYVTAEQRRELFGWLHENA